VLGFEVVRRDTIDVKEGGRIRHVFFDTGGNQLSPEELATRRAELIGKGVEVTPVIDHGWAESIYFKDPNGLLLEYACGTRDIHADDFVRESRFEVSLAGPSPFSDFRDE
jgi:catechol 2,3-dioxygenase-like lactoylglutathione lyase family enzyme